MVERKNRDLKTQLAILVGKEHPSWPDKLPSICFAMNTAACSSTGYSSAYLTFGRELRSPDDAQRDLRAIVMSENFIPQITPRLLELADTLREAREIQEAHQDRRKSCADKRRRSGPAYKVGDRVLVLNHTLSNAAKEVSAKLAPKRDGPYTVFEKVGPCTYRLAQPDGEVVPGTYHTSALEPFSGGGPLGPPFQSAGEDDHEGPPHRRPLARARLTRGDSSLVKESSSSRSPHLKTSIMPHLTLSQNLGAGARGKPCRPMILDHSSGRLLVQRGSM